MSAVRNVLAGSQDKQTSTSGAEIIPQGAAAHEFALYNYTDRHVLINGGAAVFVPGGFGIVFDRPVRSAVITESGVEFAVNYRIVAEVN
ncbi:hypothetical protein FACS189490_02330 [Clostridia bacterium]|nr:hypothetical protein FACS189490_02330 [Clostridia bacterium]